MKKLHLAAGAALVFLSGCASVPFLRHKATLAAGEDGRKALRAASHVLGKPERDLAIPQANGGSQIDIVTFDVKKGGNLALYFYKGRFIQVGSFSPDAGFSPIRTDFRDVAERTTPGPEVFVLERQRKKVVVRTQQIPR